MENFDKAISFSLPAIIKANFEGGKRMVTVEASNEAVDTEGDVVLQKGLLASAASFVANGHLDIDHYSELGPRIGITNPEWYIVGRPTEVYDGGGNRTFVKGEIRQSGDGSFDPKRPYDMLWENLTSKPPVMWYASIFGYPIAEETEDIRETGERVKGATRYLIKGINWTSLAFTRRPVNDSLKGNARIISAKSMVSSIMLERACQDGGHLYELKSGIGGLQEGGAVDAERQPIMNGYGIPGELGSLSLSHVMEAYKCAKCGPMLKAAGSLHAFRHHFTKCAGMPEGLADVLAHAGMYKGLILGFYP